MIGSGEGGREGGGEVLNNVFTFDIMLHLLYEFNAAKNNAVMLYASASIARL